jgi:hypothetical protein
MLLENPKWKISLKRSTVDGLIIIMMMIIIIIIIIIIYLK